MELCGASLGMSCYVIEATIVSNLVPCLCDAMWANGASIGATETGQVQEAKGITRTPMVLVPLEDCEKANDSVLLGQNGATFGNKSDFKMNTSIIHESGTLLLGVEDAAYVDQSFQAPNASSLPSSVEYAHAAAEEDDYDDDDLGMDDSFGGAPDMEDGTDLDSAGVVDQDETAVVASAGQTGTGGHVVTVANAKASDPWAPLDPHEVPPSAGQSNAFRRIKTYRVPSHLAAASTRKRKTKELPLPPISQFCLESFLPKPKSTVPRGVRAPAFKEFAIMYAHPLTHPPSLCDHGVWPVNMKQDALQRNKQCVCA